MRSVVSFLLGVGVTAATWWLWSNAPPEPAGEAAPLPEPMRAAPTVVERTVEAPRVEPATEQEARTAATAPIEAPIAEPEPEPAAPDALSGLSPETLAIVKDENREQGLRAFIDLLGYVPEPSDLERIAMVLVETRREHNARIRTLFDYPDFESPDRGRRLMEGKRRAFEDLYARQYAQLQPYVRPDVFEEALRKYSGWPPEKDDPR